MNIFIKYPIIFVFLINTLAAWGMADLGDDSWGSTYSERDKKSPEKDYAECLKNCKLHCVNTMFPQGKKFRQECVSDCKASCKIKYLERLASKK